MSLRPLIKHPDIVQPTDLYGTKFDEAKDLVQIPEADLPAGLPAWMRSLRSWAQRKAVNTGDLAEEKRATIIVRIPKTDREWLS